jgi:hypothetical protein
LQRSSALCACQGATEQQQLQLPSLLHLPVLGVRAQQTQLRACCINLFWARARATHGPSSPLHATPRTLASAQTATAACQNWGRAAAAGDAGRGSRFTHQHAHTLARPMSPSTHQVRAAHPQSPAVPVASSQVTHPQSPRGLQGDAEGPAHRLCSTQAG